jgi:hypothetical protein
VVASAVAFTSTLRHADRSNSHFYALWISQFAAAARAHPGPLRNRSGFRIGGSLTDLLLLIRRAGLAADYDGIDRT